MKRPLGLFKGLGFRVQEFILGGSWVVTSGVISPLIRVISTVTFPQVCGRGRPEAVKVFLAGVVMNLVACFYQAMEGFTAELSTKAHNVGACLRNPGPITPK